MEVMNREKIKEELNKTDIKILQDKGLFSEEVSKFYRNKRFYSSDLYLILTVLLMGITGIGAIGTVTIISMFVMGDLVKLNLLVVMIPILLGIGLFTINKLEDKRIENNKKLDNIEEKHVLPYTQDLTLQLNIMNLREIKQEDRDNIEISYTKEKDFTTGRYEVKSDSYISLNKTDILFILQGISSQDLYKIVANNESILINSDEKTNNDSYIKVNLKNKGLVIYLENSVDKCTIKKENKVEEI